jgi:NitT/TauT family transport system substrate-binding protein
MKPMKVLGVALLSAGILLASQPAPAADTLKLAVGQRGLLDTAISHLGQRAGIFKKHGLALDLLYTSGSGETQQAVIAGGVDVGIGGGIMGALNAYSKGAPVRIIAAQATGAAEYWYVQAASPIRTLKDTDGRTIAYSTNGSSTHSIVREFIKEFGLKARPVATGNPAATLTEVLAGRVDVGWASPPFGLKEMEEGKIRLIARANDLPMVRGQTIRVNITNVQSLQGRKDAIVRFMQAYRETIEWIYADPQAIKLYAEFAGIPESTAKRVRDEFIPKSQVQPDEIKGLDAIVLDAVSLKYTAVPLTKAQLAELIQIPASRK